MKRKSSKKEYNPQPISVSHLAFFAVVVGLLGLLYVVNVITPPVFAR